MLEFSKKKKIEKNLFLSSLCFVLGLLLAGQCHRWLKQHKSNNLVPVTKVLLSLSKHAFLNMSLVTAGKKKNSLSHLLSICLRGDSFILTDIGCFRYLH